MVARLSFWLDSLLRSYARIFFSDSRLFGAAILASSFVFPAHGLFGLIAVLVVNTAALAVGLDRSGIREGLYGFNGVLTGLGVGFFYQWNLQALVILVAASIMVLFARVLLDRFLGYYLGLPAMSLPFTLVTWLLLLATLDFGYLSVSFERLQLFQIQVPGLPEWASSLFSNFGAVLFQVNPVSGLIIAISLLLFSPTALLLCLLGFAAGNGLHNFLGIEPSLITKQFLGFNYILTALALGGIFAAPSLGSLLAAMAGVLCAVLILTSLINILPSLLTPLAMPFNLAVLLVLYTLKSRSFPELGIELIPPPEISTPEAHVAASRRSRFGPVLPFNGTWQVTQGVNGDYTHQDDWFFAYDFMAVDGQGATYRRDGNRLEDYYSFGLPVLAPAAGHVAAVCGRIEDNPVGVNNLEDNWGNYVIIEHAPELYSCLAHLKKGSVAVEVGQRVEQGQMIGICGNSGRSPYPHLHLQFQMHPFIGAASIPFRFANLQLTNEGVQHYLHRCTLAKDQIVRNLPCSPEAESFFPYRSGDLYRFESGRGNETWHYRSDEAGNQWLEALPERTRAHFSLAGCVLRFHRLEGGTHSGLYRLASLLPEISLGGEGERQWTTFAPIEHFLLRHLTAMLALFGLQPTLRLECTLAGGFAERRLSVNPTPCLKLGKLLLPLGRRGEPLEVSFSKGRGVESMRRGGFSLRLRAIEEEAAIQ
jgi:urea transporter/murein DD-endopeptidase MepM/ murein hydrolase activator NlpD